MPRMTTVKQVDVYRSGLARDPGAFAVAAEPVCARYTAALRAARLPARDWLFRLIVDAVAGRDDVVLEMFDGTHGLEGGHLSVPRLTGLCALDLTRLAVDVVHAALTHTARRSDWPRQTLDGARDDVRAALELPDRPLGAPGITVMNYVVPEPRVSTGISHDVRVPAAYLDAVAALLDIVRGEDRWWPPDALPLELEVQVDDVDQPARSVRRGPRVVRATVRRSAASVRRVADPVAAAYADVTGLVEDVQSRMRLARGPRLPSLDVARGLVDARQQRAKAEADAVRAFVIALGARLPRDVRGWIGEQLADGYSHDALGAVVHHLEGQDAPLTAAETAALDSLVQRISPPSVPGGR